jgi:hypothetical protein
VLRRDVFVPTLFANPTQQPVAMRPHYRTLAGQLGEQQLWRALMEGTPLDASACAVLGEYDFVIFVGPRPFTVPQASGVIPIITTRRFVLARLDAVTSCK